MVNKKISDTNKSLSVFELIDKNEDLIFIDAKNDIKYSLSNLLLPVEDYIGSKKKLAFLYLNNNIESIAMYLSFLKTDHALVLVSDGLKDDLKLKLELKYNPNIIYDLQRDVLEGFNNNIIHNDFISVSFYYKKNTEIVIHENSKILLSTSGTTGSPKFVKLSSNNILQNALSICDYLPINQNDVTPLNLPLYYSYGLSVFHSNAISGGEIVCNLPDILDKNFWKYFSNYGFTSIAGVPFIYEMLGKIGFLKKEYTTLKYISQAGGNLSENIKTRFNDYCLNNQVKFFVMYGQTEATARISYVPFDRLREKIKSIGLPIKNGSLSLDTETNEILYTGPNVFGGYAREKKDLAVWENIKELKTGDIGFTDEDGYFYIKGRLKRFVKIFGNRINLDEIEAKLKSSLDISLLACIGIKDQFILVAYSDEDIIKAEIKKIISDTYKIHASAVKFMYLEELPKTKNNKIDNKKITSIYLDN